MPKDGDQATSIWYKGENNAPSTRRSPASPPCGNAGRRGHIVYVDDGVHKLISAANAVFQRRDKSLRSHPGIAPLFESSGESKPLSPGERREHIRRLPDCVTRLEKPSSLQFGPSCRQQIGEGRVPYWETNMVEDFVTNEAYECGQQPLAI
jgi:hypothetical protein